ncbi:hypothetical protein M422DRAFT_27497 [Sphaerobolus stellatus SS14]|nr:hypothetical protein M422DRAFT_27497 [Sphaerobolus stellatus SS14]
MSFNDAVAACGQLNEDLLNMNTAPKMSQDLSSLLSYLQFRGEFLPGQAFWINSGNSRQPRTVQLVAGKLVQLPGISTSFVKLPALCSQSAPFRPASTSDKNPAWQVKVKSGSRTFTGFRDQVSFRFLGIPFANPPARWEYSTLFDNPKVTDINATNFGSQCWQGGSGSFSEDCLFLNVFTPLLPNGQPKTSQLKPVLFWIHGGAFTSGTGADPTVDGGSLVSRGDVVVVTINYRLTTLGFLALNDSVITGNYGLADQIVALDWVQQNIAAFGGDPNRVTIFGQSAGAASVRALLASPKATGKFAAAIPMSNLAGSDYATTYSLYDTVSQEMQTAANNIIAEVKCTNATDIPACLKAVPAQTFVSLPDVARFLVVDGEILTSNQLQVTGKGTTAHVPTMWGHMRYDGAAFIGYPSVGQSVVSALQSIIGSTSQSAVDSGMFPTPSGPNSTLNVFNVTARITTNIEFRCLDQATALSAIKHNVFPSVHFYSFYRSYQTPGYDPNAPVCDAPKTPSHPFGDPSLPYFQCHSGELYFVFGNLGQFNLPFRDDLDIHMSQLMVDTWSAFAWNHDPNPSQALLAARGYAVSLANVKQTGTWSPVSVTNPSLRKLDFPNSEQIPFEEVEECEFLGYPLDYYETQ